MKRQFWLLFTACALTLSCTPRGTPRESAEVYAYRLCDEDRADEAVTFLQDRIKEEPERRSLRMALASSYASLAKLNIYDFYEFVTESAARDAAVFRRLTDFPSIRGGSKTDVDATIDRFRSWLSAVSSVLEAFKFIPQVESDNVYFLRAAIAEIQSLVTYERHEALYLATLRIVEFKNNLAEKYFPSIFVKDTKNRCRLQALKASRELSAVAVDISAIYSDLAAAFPDSRDNLKKAQEQTNILAENLRYAVLSQNFVDMFDPNYDLGGMACK